MKFKEYLNEAFTTKGEMKSFVKQLNSKFEGASANIDSKKKVVSIYSNDNKYLRQIKNWAENSLPVNKNIRIKIEGDILNIYF